MSLLERERVAFAFFHLYVLLICFLFFFHAMQRRRVVGGDQGCSEKGTDAPVQAVQRERGDIGMPEEDVQSVLPFAVCKGSRLSIDGFSLCGGVPWT